MLSQQTIQAHRTDIVMLAGTLCSAEAVQRQQCSVKQSRLIGQVSQCSPAHYCSAEAGGRPDVDKELRGRPSGQCQQRHDRALATSVPGCGGH
eukprot:scaffold143300_cov19-Tisochrysis_lutea.AAC.3